LSWYRYLPWLFVPPIIILIIAGAYVESYDDEPWTQFSVILAAISIGVAVGIFVFQSYQQGEIAELITKGNDRDDREDKERRRKRDYYEKQYIHALTGVREQILKINGLVAKDKRVSKNMKKEWEKFKMPAERLEFLNLVSTDIMEHEIVDDIDLVKGSLKADIPDELGSVTLLLAEMARVLDPLLLEKLKDRRLEVLKEQLDHLNEQVDKALETSDNKDALKLFRETRARQIRRRYGPEE